MHQIDRLKEKLQFACPKCGTNDYCTEIRVETIITFNAASGDQRLDTTRTSQARITVKCNKCGESWSPA